MDLKKSRVILAIVFVACCFAFALGQDQIFSDPAVEYSFTIPDRTWKPSVRPSATNPNVEFVYGDRRDGHLMIRRIDVKADAIMTDVVQDEALKRLQFLPGYVAGKEENFNSKFRASAFNYEYVTGGHPMAGRIYFLRSNPTTVYILRFTGPKDDLRRIRNQTDSIARTFDVKPV